MTTTINFVDLNSFTADVCPTCVATTKGYDLAELGITETYGQKLPVFAYVELASLDAEASLGECYGCERVTMVYPQTVTEWDIA